MKTHDLRNAKWFKSSYSANNGNCVEVAIFDDAVAVRDSKNPTGPALQFSAQTWSGFVAAVRDGNFEK